MLRFWWQKAKKPLEIAVVSIFGIGLIVLVTLVILGTIFQWNWTGLGPATSDPKQHAKTLWDWLQLLIIPAVLAIGGYVFNLTTSRNEQQSTQLRDQTEREIAFDNQREAALQAYIDKMSELLLERKLRESANNDEVRKIARVRTLSVLPRLDKIRKRSILQFLYESGLLKKDNCILDLTEADLSGATLSGANLYKADLSGTNLSGTNLSGASLSFATLIQATLSGANLSGADIRGANLYETTLSGADLIQANLIQTDLIGADLSGANLHKAILSEADLSGANLSGADLSGANLSGANLKEVFFSGADLSGANLSGANLKGARSITTEQLDKAQSLQKAIMPDGSIHA